MCMFIGGACLSHTLGASLLVCNVVNRAMSDVQIKCMPICSFHIKTNIVIPTCTSDRFPPVLPSLAYVADIEELTEKSEENLFCQMGWLPGINWVPGCQTIGESHSGDMETFVA